MGIGGLAECSPSRPMMERAATVEERLKSLKAAKENELAAIDEAIDLLNKNPDTSRLLTLMSSIGLRC
jgi:sugar-specific transcriptional regulator TrmB